MGRISVGKTVGDALSFAFEHYLPNLGVVWLPFLILGAVLHHLLPPIIEHSAAVMTWVSDHPGVRPPPEISRPSQAIWLLLVAEPLLFAWMLVGLTKEALGLRSGFRPVYLAIGMAELRLIGAAIVFYILIVALAVAIGIVAGIVVGTAMGILLAGAAQHADGATVAAYAAGSALVTAMIVLVPLFYVMLRLGFFLLPVTVAEKRFGLWRSWELSKGHVWALVGIAIVMLLILIAVEVVLLVAIMAVFGGALASALSVHGIPHDVRGATTVVVALMRSMTTLLPYFLGASVLITPILYGLQVGASVSAYREVTAGENADKMLSG